VQIRTTVRSNILKNTSYEYKLLLSGIILPVSLTSFFIYIIISLIDVERSGIFNSIPSLIILSIGTILSLKLLFYTKLEKEEIQKFRLIFLALFCWLIGELIYFYQQIILGISVPYPSIADISYLLAAVFFSFHLYSILRLKKDIFKTKVFIYLGFLASIFPIYLLIDSIYYFEQYYSNSIMEFITNASYYILDAILLFPCIGILLYTPKNDPFIFHWLLIILSIFTLVTADLGYTFIASINEELLKNIEWLLSFIYSMGYILLTVSILWFSKIKEILEYKKLSLILQNEQKKDLSGNKLTNEYVEKLENSNEILRSIINITEKTDKYLDILFAQYIIQQREVIKIIDILTNITKKNKILKVRILLPSSKFNKKDISSYSNPNLLIEYFDRHLSSNTITIIQDNEFMYVLTSESENTNDYSRYYIESVNNESKRLVYTTLFERLWLLEKSIDFG
jgi:hypothetical protein